MQTATFNYCTYEQDSYRVCYKNCYAYSYQVRPGCALVQIVWFPHKGCLHYSVMADECTDIANKEQFTICIGWIDSNLQDHEDFIGLYEVDNISADCLVFT